MPSSRSLRFSVGTLLMVVTAACLAMWWWQLPYTVETPEPLSHWVDRKVVRTVGRRVESFRRRPFSDPMKHGPTRVFDSEERLISEEEWRHGVRHGMSRRWRASQDPDPGELLMELKFERGGLVRVNGRAVTDFMQVAEFTGASGERIREALLEQTDLSYDDIPLRDAIDDIQLRHEMPVMLDNGVAPDLRITASDRSLPVFAGFCSMLSPLDLTCRFRHGVLWVTREENELGVERVRGVGDDARFKERVSGGWLDVPVEQAFSGVCGSVSFVNESSASGNVTLELARMPRQSLMGILFHKLGVYGQLEEGVLVIRDVPK